MTLGSTVALFAAGGIGAQTTGEDCSWAGPDPLGIGIDRLRCIGGECQINIAGADGGLEHRFSTEPRIDRLRPGAPDQLREGDVIVSVDGVPITTREGGRRLARLTRERDVVLGVRRDESFLELRLRPAAGCPIGGLAVRRPSTSGDE